ncbi:MAG: YdcF family protein [Eubacteriales bacterium]
MKNKKFRVFLIIIVLFLIVLSVNTLRVSNFNLGVILPFLFALPLLIYLILAKKMDIWFKTKPGKIIKWIFISGYSFIIIFSLILISMMVYNAYKQPEKDADAIIVLGAGIHGKSMTYILQNRLNKAIEYAQENPNTLIVVSGGQGPQEEIAEAQAMNDYLIQEGIPQSRIIKEDRATSTEQNFKFSKELLDKRFDNTKMVFVTSETHTLRAKVFAEKAGFADPQPIAAETPLYILPSTFLREIFAVLALPFTTS